MSDGSTYILYEWQPALTLDDQVPTKESYDKLNASFENYLKYTSSDNKRTIGLLKDRSVNIIDGKLTNSGNNVGLIQTADGTRFEFKPKFDRSNTRERAFWKFLPRMLNTLYNFKDFNQKIFIDPESKLILPSGFNYFPLLALSFASLCDKVLKVGLIKKYVKKTERLKSIKGKINFPSFVKNKSWIKTEIPCTYFELTFDNTENQIILWCANRLIKSLKSLESNSDGIYISRKLKEQFILLAEEITLKPVTKTELSNTSFKSIAPHYIDIMNICQAILQESLFSLDETSNKSVIGVNFLIDMDWVFEQYISYLFEKTQKNNPRFDTLDIRIQLMDNLCDLGRINIRPDLLIFKDGKPVAIIDFKWKQLESNNNADYYQIICYALAQLENIDKGTIYANLFSVSNFETERVPIDTISDIFSNKESKIDIGKIPLNTEVFDSDNAQMIEDKIISSITNYLNTLV